MTLHHTTSAAWQADIFAVNQQQYHVWRAACQANSQDFWRALAHKHLYWHQNFTQVCDLAHVPPTWFADGLMNACYQCVDLPAQQHPDKIAIIAENEAGHIRRLSYAQLHAQVMEMAHYLQSQHLSAGDRVMIYLPNQIEAVVAMQACARLGLVHCVVFAGFSPTSLAQRMEDAQPKYIITADAYQRGKKLIPLKQNVDEALVIMQEKQATFNPGVVVHAILHTEYHENQLNEATQQLQQNYLTQLAETWQSTHAWWHDVKTPGALCPITWVDAEHPLFILYTSGSTGKPKGIFHASAGYLLCGILSMRWTFNIPCNDQAQQQVFFCTADVGWITGHTYIAYAPLACGITQVMFSGAPLEPGPDRYWAMIARHHVNIFYTAPTAIRTLMQYGEALPRQHDLSSLRLLGSVGEPINPSAWSWYHQHIGQKTCPIVDTWWQTETGAHMLTPLHDTPAKPGACMQQLPWIFTQVRDDDNQNVPTGAQGKLLITQPFPSMARGIWGDRARFLQTYFPNEHQGDYLTGDAACLDVDQALWIKGRIDDVMNVAGHRLGTMELESALARHPQVLEAAAVPVQHAIKGEAIAAFIILKKIHQNAVRSDQERTDFKHSLQQTLRQHIGAIAQLERVYIGQQLPKTRSGKVMRRLLRDIAQDKDVKQDTSTLENADVLHGFECI